MANFSEASDNTAWQACILAIVAGYADAVGFLIFGTFAGAMTGNTVLLGIALAGAKFNEVAQNAAIIASFMVGVAGSAFLRYRHIPLAVILGVEAAALVAAALIVPLAAAPVLAFAMGLQNAAMTHFAGGGLNTVFLTGNLQKMIQSLFGRAVHEQPAAASDVRVIAWLWVSYLSGVILGALACHWTAYPLLLAILPLPAVLLNIGSRRKA